MMISLNLSLKHNHGMCKTTTCGMRKLSFLTTNVVVNHEVVTGLTFDDVIMNCQLENTLTAVSLMMIL